jgi:hypothetical protein
MEGQEGRVAPPPLHTTVHAGPHRAVRRIELRPHDHRRGARAWRRRHRVRQCQERASLQYGREGEDCPPLWRQGPCRYPVCEARGTGSVRASGPASRRVLLTIALRYDFTLLRVHDVVKRTFTSKRSNVPGHTSETGSVKTRPSVLFATRHWVPATLLRYL